MNPGAGKAWFVCLWLAVAFTPTLRLGEVPVRADDLLVFGGLGLVLLTSAQRGAVGRLPAVGWVLIATAAYILLVTVRGSPIADLSVGPREYLDVARPLKFVALLWMVQQMDPEQVQGWLARLIPPTMVALVALGLVQVFLLQPWSQGPLVAFSLSFTELEDWHARSMLGQRASATFHTPTDLGYFATLIGMCALLWKDLRHRNLVLLAALAGLALSGTRTFLFALPLILAMYALLTSRNLVRTVQRLALAAVLVAIGAALTVYLLPDFRYHIQVTLESLATGDLTRDQSILDRLTNLHLVEIAMRAAPLTGVISRDFFTRGVDSEYIITIHRYGLIGLALTVAFYAVAVSGAWRTRRTNLALSTLALLVLALTFIYGITQGALISTRVGLLPMLFIAIERGHARRVATEARDAAARGAPHPGGGDGTVPVLTPAVAGRSG